MLAPSLLRQYLTPHAIKCPYLTSGKNQARHYICFTVIGEFSLRGFVYTHLPFLQSKDNNVMSIINEKEKYQFIRSKFYACV